MTKNAGQPEDFIKAKLRQLLPTYCLFREEIKGVGPLGQEVRIDFWCKPKDHLIGLGWPDRPFGIEAKAAELEDHRKRSAIRLVYQAAMYRLSRFPTKAGMVQPERVLLYPQLSVVLGLGERTVNQRQSFEDGLEYALVRLAALYGVGELVINERYCEVRLNGARDFDSVRGKSKANPRGQDTTRASR